jgi:acyl transferase domain-containing protein/NAD(P)-dependent dehydrogenase (short-subunit alcohol dehydrogenase family)/acyl carrier protein
VEVSLELGSLQNTVAIIGLGCRFPGRAENPAAYWDMLKAGADGIVDIPPDRWNIDTFYDPHPNVTGKMYVRAGGFLRQRIDQFDAQFFGLSPREAAYLDPQQRLLLEVAWEALEDAGLVAERLAGSDTGVYIGGFMLDNMLAQFSPLNREQIGPHSAVSSTLSILSNRLSYMFDLRGPSVTMDTACSSSLVALHYARQAIQRGECAVALAGGVNVMHRPETPIAMCKGGFLAPDGRCKSFDARADGYGRGEGAGIVVLKSYATAVRDGDPMYALIRGTGVNQDGRTDGITVPNPHSQEALIRQVCAEAGVAPQEVRYAEAHGTGTALGDPLEAAALGATLGAGRSRANALVMGSVKANIGHLEAAAGIASIIKVALCLKHATIPPLANLATANPAIPFETLGLRLPLALEPMPAGEGPACASVNAFGYGGTNAHALLQEAPSVPVAVTAEEPALHLLPLSARRKSALDALAAAYGDLLAAADAPLLRDVCASAALRRERHDHRLALVAPSREAMTAQLRAAVAHEPRPGIVTGTASAKGQRPVFVFTGMGPQWWAMGREMLRAEPVFRRVAEDCDAIFCRLTGWSVLAEMTADESASRMAETQVAQPANFILQVGLAALWRARGVEPAAIVGHSVGEVSAAYVAGVLSLEDAVRVAYHRSRLQQTVAGLGTMLAVGLPEAAVAPILARYGTGVSLAAANGPTATTLAGDAACLTEIAEELRKDGVFQRFLKVEVAYHSPSMDRIQPELLAVLRDVAVRPATVTLYSTVTGERAAPSAGDAAYWGRNTREPVYFARAMRALFRDGHRVFLEVGPHPVLSASIRECLAEAGIDGIVLTSLRRDKPEAATFLEALGGLYVAGCLIDWQQVHAGSRFVPLPTYPWQRETHWHETGLALADRLGQPDHALLGSRTTGPEPAWDSSLNPNLLPYLPDHQVQDLTVLPGAAYVELGLAIHAGMTDGAPGALENLQFHKALVVEGNTQAHLHTSYDPATRRYAVHSRARDGAAWQLHATGRLSFLPQVAAASVPLTELRARCTDRIDHDTHYADMRRRGLQYGPHFQGLQSLWCPPDRGEVLALIEAMPPRAGCAMPDRLAPTALDACFQSMFTMAPDDGCVYVPVRLRDVRLYRTPAGRFWCHGRLIRTVAGLLECDLTLFDEAGEVLADLRGLEAQALSQTGRDGTEESDQWLYQFARQDAEPTAMPSGAAGRWLVFADEGGVCDHFGQRLQEAGGEIVGVRPGSAFRHDAVGGWQLRMDSADEIARLLDVALAEPVAGILYLWGLDAARTDDPVGLARLMPALYLVQALARIGAPQAPKLLLVTRQAHPIAGEVMPEAGIVQAPLVGLVRVAVNEFASLRFRLIDIDDDAATLPALANELLSDSDEDDVALRGTARQVNRLVRRSASDLDSEAALTKRRTPGVGEIECALRLVPFTGDAAPASGRGRTQASANTIACAIVVRTGPETAAPQPNDTALVPLRDSPAPFVTLPAALAVKLPQAIGGEHQALLPAFVGAHYALEHVARLACGEAVLVHAANSALGSAAVVTARRLGARVYATADGAAAHAYLRSLGAEHVLDMGSGQFADEIMRLTGGSGIDVALNVAGGELAARTLTVLAPFGRFLHVSGRQDWPLDGLTPLHPNQSIATIDLHGLMTHRPALFARLVAEVCERVPADDMALVPLDVVTSAQLAGLDPPPPVGVRAVGFAGTATPTEAVENGFRSDATYLLTGGFGGFGLEVADWLVASGARNLVLAGRSGAATPAARQAVERLRQSGARVLPVAADIADEAAVQRLLAEATATMPPLRGVFHAAGVLDDSPISGVTRARLETVLRPKAIGAWHLHCHTKALPLDHFVLFSSIASLVGNPGQATYVAANAFLDSLALHRRGQGLPAISINWGALAEVGMAARHEGVEAHLNRVGVGFFQPKQAIALLDRIVRWRPAVLGAANMDWQLWGEAWPAWAASPRYRHLMPKGKAADGGGKGETLRRLRALAPQERRSEIQAIVSALVAEIIRLPEDAIVSGQSLLNMGVDSLMAMEIQVAIERQLGIKVSTLELMKGDSLEQLVGRLTQMASEDTAPPASPDHAPAASGPASAERINAEIAALSDAEVERALEQLLMKEGQTA